MAKSKLFQKTTVDSDTEAALSIVEMERKREELKQAGQEQREILIAQCHEVIGRVQANNLMAKFGNVASLVYLQQVKESKIYKDLPGIGTWDSFCNYIGLSRRKVDEDLLNLSSFGQEFLETCCQLSVGYRDLRKLRKLTHDGDVVIDAEFVTIGEERIPLEKDHADDLEAAIESLLEAKNQQLQENSSTLKAKDKVLKDKERVINKQAKELARLEGRAERLGYEPGEEALIQELDNARTTIDGFLMRFDPEKNPLPDDATVRMRAKLMHTLDYFKRVIMATYDTAVDLYGEPEMDDDWLPPHLRKSDDAVGDANDEAPHEEIEEMVCSSCQFRKARNNSTPGVLIPGQFGKCTKPGGLCEFYKQEE